MKDILYSDKFGQFLGKKLKDVQVVETKKIESKYKQYDHEEITILRLVFEDEEWEESSIEIQIGEDGFDIYWMRYLYFDFNGVE